MTAALCQRLAPFISAPFFRPYSLKQYPAGHLREDVSVIQRAVPVTFVTGSVGCIDTIQTASVMFLIHNARDETF